MLYNRIFTNKAHPTSHRQTVIENYHGDMNKNLSMFKTDKE